MKSKIQSIASPGPAMKPSSDIDLFTTTLPLMALPSFFIGSSRGTLSPLVLRGLR